MKEQSERDTDSPLFHGVEGAGDPGKEVMAREPSINEMLASVANQPNAVDRVAVMERLIALKEHVEDREAKIRFDDAFRELQRRLPVVKKTKLNKATGSYYAELEDMQAEWDPILFDLGFSYSWREELVNEGLIKRTWFDLSNFGHTKSNFFDAPKIEPNRAQNAIMVSGVQSTYGYRYSYRAGVGGRVEGEDTDGNIEIDEELRSALEKINKAPDLQNLMDVYQIAYKRYEGNPNQLRLVVGEYNLAKQAIARKPNV